MKHLLSVAALLAFGVFSFAAPADAKPDHKPGHKPNVVRKHHAPAPHGWNGHFHNRPHGVRPVVVVNRHNRVFVPNYHLKHGHRFRFGVYYNGFRHFHWSRVYWDARYGTHLYFDPYTAQYYYWCAPHYRFYPVTYVPLGVYSFPVVPNPQPPAVAVPPPPAFDPNVPPNTPPPPVMPPAQD
jgi:hypothetical protein